MINPSAEANQGQGSVWQHGLARNFSDDRNILTGRKAGNQIVELEHKTHMMPAVGRQLGLSGVAKIKGGRCCAARRRGNT